MKRFDKSALSKRDRHALLFMAAIFLGVAGVQFNRDVQNLEAEDTTSPYSLMWNTATAATGQLDIPVNTWIRRTSTAYPTSPGGPNKHLKMTYKLSDHKVYPSTDSGSLTHV